MSGEAVPGGITFQRRQAMGRCLVAGGLAVAMALAAASGSAVGPDKAAQDEAVAGLDGGSVRGFIWPQSARGTGATIYRITAMSVDLKELTDHDHSDECPVCRAQNIVRSALLPAASAWEATDELPRFSVALQGAAELLGVMLEEGISREDIESVLGQLLDDIELRIAEDKALGGPPMGSA
ncbi:MAG: hypothetical protein IIB65_10275 [Proteobacteria bacterium]|nr:hypothetical protein [Pseudomonadota bacterium]